MPPYHQRVPTTTLNWRSLRLISRIEARRLRPRAEAGDTVDAFNLALALERLGRVAEAEHWYRRVAVTGDVEATCNLGLLLARTGRESEALTYLATAADKGDSEAAYNAGAVCEDLGDPLTAHGWYQRAADLGDRDAARWLERRRDGTL